ncbi:transposase [Plantactinospora sp. KLBMP9567]|uniref:RNA-guided endonuclease InsQ/TnpB family protein n=1 Tax=Plantactinospora sp. KLBMP9567 TaxID=3085900 RepID=UPI002981700A|nr:transposase [Plantactinospora sp. KLBMP9567]MDW5327418.1 transposase [Plantactinospora sp. KLBMP9567]
MLLGVGETVRYTFRLRPGAAAEAALSAEWGRCRWLWNEAVHQQRSGCRPTFGRLSKLLTEARARSSWLRDGSQVAQQQTLRTYALALQHSFRVKGRGRPRPKRRKDALPSLEYTTRGFSIRDRRLRLPGGVTIPVVWSRELPSDPSSVRVYQDCLGYWYASFVVRRETAPAPVAEGAIGVGWGVATTTDAAYDLPYLGHRKRCSAELAKLQRRMARRRRSKGAPPSNGYLRAKPQAAKIAKKAARQNTHDARVWAKKVVDNHATIAVEDFQPTFLAKSRMARQAADAAIGAAKRELVERGMRAGRKVVLVPPAHTTMTCSQCGTRAKHRLGPGVRVFRCDTCGHTACRDRNAARTILATAERGRAGADDVRHAITSSRGGALVRSESEIPRLPAMGKR